MSNVLRKFGKTDTHLFTPTQIVFDNEQDVVMIRGNQGRIGQPEITDVKDQSFLELVKTLKDIRTLL